MKTEEHAGKVAEIRSDDLESPVRALLLAHELPANDDAIDWLSQQIESARDCATFAFEHPRMAPRIARKLLNSTRTILEMAEEHNLSSREELQEVRRLRRFAEVELLRPATPSGPQIRPWLWYWCLEFLDTWRSLTSAPDGVWMREGDAPSPALKFLTACCGLVDVHVNASAILYAKRNAPSPSKKDWGLSSEEFREMAEQSQIAYEKFWQSKWMQKLHEPDL